jgi:hypothetical protein
VGHLKRRALRERIARVVGGHTRELRGDLRQAADVVDDQRAAAIELAQFEWLAGLELPARGRRKCPNSTI